MKLSHFATSHIKAILFVTLVLCAVGGSMLASFPVAILPDVTFPRIVIIAEAGEQPTRKVEIGITRVLEAAVATVPDVTRIRSTTQRGADEVSVDFAWGTDMMTSQNLINNKVNEVRSSLPPGTDVTVERMNPTVFPVLGLSLRSKRLSQAQLWTLATYTLRPRLARVPGVARVVVQGGRVPEMVVEVKPQRLAAYGLSLADVESSLSGSNVVRAVGRLDQHFQQYQVLVTGEQTAGELGNVAVTQRGGVPILLRYLADVHESVQDRTTIVTAEGAEAVLINIVRQPTANTMSVVAAMQAELAQIKPTLPAGVEVATFYDQSILIGEAINSVRDAVLIGAFLAVVVLMLFLGDWRATAVTAAIIPATVLITFLLMRLAGLTLNLMTLGALAVGIGLVIDDAIVVVENVFRQLSHGSTPTEAVLQAAGEIAAPMISSTLTTVVVFLPLVLLSGVAGAFFTALAMTLIIALMVSLVLALLVSPSLCASFLRVRPGAAEHGRLFERVLGWYERLLRTLLRHPYVLPVGAVAILGMTLYFSARLGTGFMPEMDEGAFILDYRTPPGTSLDESNRILYQIEAILRDTPEVASFSRRTGTELGFAITESNRGDFAVMLKSGSRRKIDAVMDDVREKVTSQVPGIDIDFTQVLQDLIGDLAGSPAAIEIKLWGTDQKQLATVAKAVGAKLEKVPGAVDMKTGVVEAGPELVARVDALKAGRVGLTPDMIATQANAAMYGDVVTQLLQVDRQVNVRVRYPAAFRDDATQLSNLSIHVPGGGSSGGSAPSGGASLGGTSTGGTASGAGTGSAGATADTSGASAGGFNLPLATLAHIESVPGTSEVSREDQRRLDAVTANLSGRDLGSAMKDVQQLIQSTKLPPGITYTLGGQYQSQNESFHNLLMVLAIAILLVFGVMLFQFGSFTAPLTILLVMPLSLFGVTFGLWLTGTPFNVSSFMGAVMLVGVVVKNGILLLDHAQQEEKRGVPLEAAVLDSGRVRLRPILMTTLTAILGLLPLALGLGAGAEMQKPLAIAVIGGLSFSTIFTLLFAPLLYVTLRRWQIGRVGVPVRVAATTPNAPHV